MSYEFQDALIKVLTDIADKLDNISFALESLEGSNKGGNDLEN